MEFCNVNGVIPNEQFGFRKNSNCEMALISAVDGWCKAVGNGEYVGSLLIDLSKAFDMVSHNKLLSELQSIGCCLDTLKWFESYLQNRKQRVVLQDHLTNFISINQGVPQVSALSPLLFNVFVRALPRCVKSDAIQFADDIPNKLRKNAVYHLQVAKKTDTGGLHHMPR